VRVTAAGWALAVLVAVTVVLAFVAPGAALVTGIVAALALVVLLSEGFTNAVGWFDIDVAAERKREALRRRFRGGRPVWERTPPDAPDEPADRIWERERRRRSGHG
jgi:hypothetical protein